MVPVNRCGSCSTTPKLRRKLFQIEFANVDSANANAAALHLIEAQQQAGERGLARSGVAHHGDGFAGLDPEAYVVEYPVLVFIGEPYVVEFDGRGLRGKWLRALFATEFPPECPAV